ncbi:hypothetical protein OHB01_29560 [Microbispora hainanensis]|uniref:MFS transporter n=1 Tax=Microbispora hainanensis TaxID=568844 RepID=A0ABZ1T284_9ACTN|nr:MULTISPECIES: hypothetical protein [Microbispora]
MSRPTLTTEVSSWLMNAPNAITSASRQTGQVMGAPAALAVGGAAITPPPVAGRLAARCPRR